jgi:hypothetical protein
MIVSTGGQGLGVEQGRRAGHSLGMKQGILIFWISVGKYLLQVSLRMDRLEYL